MKKNIIITLIFMILLLSACAPQTTSPEAKAAFCNNLDVFYQDLEALLSMGADSPDVELKAAYSTAAASFHTLQESGKAMSEPEVKAFFDAASGLNTALDYYVNNTNPDPTSKAAALANLKQQSDLFKEAYKVLAQTVCPE